MTTFAAHVIHVPHVSEIRDQITNRFVDAGACVHTEQHLRGIMAPWSEVLRHAVNDGTDWTLVLQDDADPLDHWQDHVEAALRHSPVPVLALTHFGSYGVKAARAGYAYAAGRNLIWGAAVAIRADVVAVLPAFIDRVFAIDPSYPHDDNLLGVWADQAGVKTGFTSRAIFDHADTPSLLGHHGLRDNRRPHLTTRDPGPWWSTPGYASRSLTYYSPVTKRLIAALG